MTRPAVVLATRNPGKIDELLGLAVAGCAELTERQRRALSDT